MAVIKNMMVRAGADFSAFTTQAKKASQSMKGMRVNVTRSCNAMKKAVSGVSRALGALGVAVTVTAIVAAAKDAAEAYDEQAEAEIKLATVMRNTMGARNEEIQSILDLCTAQQRMGVISADAQVAGAQEMATYLSLSSSLKTLIPVMNDMAAQQYGFNVTAEQCTQIATMLGKVMEGQTGALSRYGYYFTEAEEAILKYGTEAERAATLARIVEGSVGGVNHALAQTPSGRMRQLANAMDDIKAKFGECVRIIGVLLLPLLWKVAEILELIAYWANRALNSIAKVFGYASLLTGWQDIGTGIGDLGADFGSLGSYIGAAGEAAEEAKRKMLGIDELNVLGGNGTDGGGGGSGGSGGGSGGSGGGSGGSGSGSGGTGGLLGMLEGMGGGEGTDEGIGWLETMLYKVKDHLSLIKDLAWSIGAAFIGWKVLKQFLPKIGQGFGAALTKVLGLVSAIFGAVLGVKSGLRAWNEGINLDNLYGMLWGTSSLVLGLGTAFGKTGAAIGAIVAGIGLAVVGMKSSITEGITWTSAALTAGGTAMVGAAIGSFFGPMGTLIGGLIGLAVGALADLGVLIYQKWDEISAWVSDKWAAVSAWFAGIGEAIFTWWQETCTAIAEFATQIWQGIVDWCSNALTTVMDAMAVCGEWIRTTASNIWQWIVNTWINLKTKTIETFTNIKATVQTNITAAKQHITANMEAAKANAIASWNALKASCTSIFSQVKSTIITMISQATAHLMSVSWVSIGVNLMQGFLNGLRSLMSTIWNEVVSFVQRCTAAVRGALGIHSPSSVFAEIGEQLDAGLIVGLRSGMPDVMDEMSDISGALEASVHPKVLAEGGLAGQYEISGAAADLSDGDGSLDGLLQTVLQLYDWLRTEGSRPHVTMIDGREVFETVVEENNRAIRRTGASPIRV